MWYHAKAPISSSTHLFGARRPTNRIFVAGPSVVPRTTGSAATSNAAAENSSGNTFTAPTPRAAISAALKAESAQTASAARATSANSPRAAANCAASGSSKARKCSAGVTLWYTTTLRAGERRNASVAGDWIE